MIANAYGCRWWSFRYGLIIAEECRRRAKEAEDKATDVLGDDHDDEWERLDYLFEELEEEADAKREEMEERIDNVKTEYKLSLHPSKRSKGPSGVPRDRFENAIEYTNEVCGLTNLCAQEICLIEAKYDELCIRRKAHFAYRLELWKAHLKLFAVGMYVSPMGFPRLKIGTHCKVDGEIETQVQFGAYVHVDEGQVYADGCMPHIAGIDYEDDVPFGLREGIIKIGELYRIDPDIRQFSAIVWKKSYDRVDGLDDDDCGCEDTFDFRELHYDLFVLGSSDVLRYNQWDMIYSPLKEYVRRKIIEANSSDNDAASDTAVGSSDDDDNA